MQYLDLDLILQMYVGIGIQFSIKVWSSRRIRIKTVHGSKEKERKGYRLINFYYPKIKNE